MDDCSTSSTNNTIVRHGPSNPVDATDALLPPFPVASSVSSETDSDDNDISFDRGGGSPVFEMLRRSSKEHIVPPNTICTQRSLSAGIVTDQNVIHSLLNGRPQILLPPISGRVEGPPMSTQHGTMSPSYQYTERSININPIELPPLRATAWSEALATSFTVRGATYLRDGGKKVPSLPALFQLLTVDLVSAPDGPQAMCTHPNERIQRTLQRERETGQCLLPEFVFAVNLCVPSDGASGNNSKSSCYNLVSYFGIHDKSLIQSDETAVGRLCNSFFFGESDEMRNRAFKLIPRVAQGNFVVRKAVGSKPTILGNKLLQRFVRTDRVLEVIVDIGSDAMAAGIVKLALGCAKNLTVDMMFLLEGTTAETLPEHILGGVRIKEVDFKQRDGQRVVRRVSV